MLLYSTLSVPNVCPILFRVVSLFRSSRNVSYLSRSILFFFRKCEPLLGSELCRVFVVVICSLFYSFFFFHGKGGGGNAETSDIFMFPKLLMRLFWSSTFHAPMFRHVFLSLKSEIIVFCVSICSAFRRRYFPRYFRLEWWEVALRYMEDTRNDGNFVEKVWKCAC